MSFNRENIVWESPDGTWNIGFYETHQVNGDRDDYDPEWDVEYNYGVFEWVSTGHPDQEAAMQSFNGPNPGGHSVSHNDGSDDYFAYAKKLDKMVEDSK